MLWLIVYDRLSGKLKTYKSENSKQKLEKLYYANDKKYEKLLGLDFSWLRKTNWNWTISFQNGTVYLNDENWTLETGRLNPPKQENGRNETKHSIQSRDH